jgi:serine/threonine protein kinase
MRPDQVRTEVGRAVSDPRFHRNVGLLGDYRLGARLDDGGSNEVYEASAPGSAGKVVIKFLRRAVSAGPQATEACREERARVAELHHPNVANLLALGTTTEGVPYLVREHFDFPTLETYLAGRGPLHPLEAAVLVKRIAVPLAATHSIGVFHGELRPSKIFLTEAAGFPAPLIKIVDFGLWRLAGDRRGPGAQADTVRLAAPELILGAPALDGQLDQYALAAIAFRMVTGVDLFPSDDVAAVLRSVLEESPPPALELLCGDERVAAVIHRALSKNPAERYPNVLDFAAALERIAVGSAPSTADYPVLAVAPRAPEGEVAEETTGALLGQVERDRPRCATGEFGPVDGAQPFAEMEESSLRLVSVDTDPAGATWDIEVPPPRRGHLRQRRSSRWGRALIATILLATGASIAWWSGLRGPVSDLHPAALWERVVALRGR